MNGKQSSMNTIFDYNSAINRRQFFRKNGTGLGVAALSSLMARSGLGSAPSAPDMSALQHFAPKAKRATRRKARSTK